MEKSVYEKLMADIATLDAVTDQAKARRVVKGAVYRRVNNLRGDLIHRKVFAGEEFPLLAELQRACLRITRLANPDPKCDEHSLESGVSGEVLAALVRGQQTHYLVVVFDPSEEEGRSQTVGLFDNTVEADAYAAELNEGWPAGQSMRAVVQSWLVGDMRM